MDINVAQLTDLQLVELQLHKNDWHVRHARRNLQQRAAAGKEMGEVHAALLEMFAHNDDITRKLRALWALHVTDGCRDAFLIDQLNHSDPYIRAWSIRLLADPKRVAPAAVKQFATMARRDDSSLVRLHLASALQRLPLADRWSIAEELVAHPEDVDDSNLPLMIWYGIGPLVPRDTPRALQLAARSKIPLIRQFIARRAASL